MKKWQWGVTVICIFLMFFNQLLPPVGGLSEVGMATLCIFIGGMALLILVDLMWPVFLLVLAFPLSHVYSLNETLQMSFGHSVFNFVVFMTMLLYVLQKTGVMERMAIWMISRPFTKKNPWLFICSLWGAELLLGSIMDVTSITILFATLTIQILESIGVKKGDRLGQFIMLGLLVFAGVSYGITPISHSVPVMGISLFSELQPISFIQYSLVGYVIAIAMFVVFFILMRFVYKLDLSPFENFDPTTLHAEKCPMDKREKISVTIFVLVVIAWLLPSLVQDSLPAVYGALNDLGIVGPVFIALIAMTLIRIDGKPLLDISDGLRNGVVWGAAYPLAAAMLLGSAITNPETGITDALINWIGPGFSRIPTGVFVLSIVFINVIVTVFASDTVALLLVSTISVSMLQSGIITNINAGALCVALGVSACAAFAAPPGGTYPAVISGTGWLDRKVMFFHGWLMAIILGVICGTVGYGVGCLIF